MTIRRSPVIVACLACAALGAGEAAPPEPRAGIAACTVSAPQGDYALVTLVFTVKGAPKGYESWTYMGGLRGGRMRMDDGVGLTEPGGWLELKDGKLTGSFRRNNSISTSSTQLTWAAPQQVTVDAAVAGGEISGNAKIGEVAGSVTGRIVGEAALAKANAVAADKGWPNTQGPLNGGCAAQPSGAATVDAPGDLRQVWRCEEGDIGQGLGSITRFMFQWKNASGRRAGTNSNGAVVEGGRLYCSYFVPTPRPADVPEQPNLAYQKTEKVLYDEMLAQAKAEGWTGDALPSYAAEKIWQSADDVVACMDAATGKTIWKAVVKARGVNVQHHKSGPFGMSPALGAGKVFAFGMSGWLYAFDAATGKPLWEVQAVSSPLNLKLDGSCSLLVADGVLVGPAGGSWGGYDVGTGKLLWKSGGRGVSTLVRWANGGREHLIGRMGAAHVAKGLTCIEAKTGKELWTAPIEVRTGGRGLGPGGLTVVGDRLLAYRLKSAAGAKAAGGDDEGGGGKDKVDAAIACYALSASGLQPQWEVDGGTHGESVPVVVHGKYVFSADLRVIELATGKVLGQSQGPMPGNGGYMQVIEDIVLVRTDGTHGGIRCGFYKVAPDGAVRLLNTDGKEWSPAIGGSTSSYHHPIFYPMVDGRMFLRQQDGVYCWDLRAKQGG